MPRKSVKKDKTSKQGKGDVKQSVKVSVRIGDAKPKRKRAYRRKPRGEGGLARPEETRTLYGNLPPPPPQQIVYTPQIPPAFQQQPKISGLLEDVKKERTNLLEDIKREISGQIAKSQGAEQRASLQEQGFFDPFSTEDYAMVQPRVNERIQMTAPSFTDLKRGESQPIITEPEDEIMQALPFQSSLFIEDIGIQKPKRKYRTKEEIAKEREIKLQKQEQRRQQIQQQKEEKKKLAEQKKQEYIQRGKEMLESKQMKSQDINISDIPKPIEEPKTISKQQQLTDFFEPIKKNEPNITAGISESTYLKIGEEPQEGKEYIIKIKRPKKGKK